MKDAAAKAIYRRVLLKLSGESLQGDSLFGIDADRLSRVADEIISTLELGVQLALVVGAGNLIRGADLCAAGLDRVTADREVAFEILHSRRFRGEPVRSRDHPRKYIGAGFVGGNRPADVRVGVGKRDRRPRNEGVGLIADNAADGAVGGLRPGRQRRHQQHHQDRADLNARVTHMLLLYQVTCAIVMCPQFITRTRYPCRIS